MNIKRIAIGVLPFVLVVVATSQESATPKQGEKHYTHAQLKNLLQDAHTPEEYNSLALYYGNLQKHYLLVAAEEKREWERRSQNVMGTFAKYPRPVDSAHYLCEYYGLKATEAEGLSEQ